MVENNNFLKEPKVCIILINWNQRLITIECIESLKKINYSNYEIILVDNGSKNDDVDFFIKSYPGVVVISNSKNLGFAEANNIGIKKAIELNADYVFILNNDTIVDKNVVKELIFSISKDKSIAAVAPKVYNYYKKNIIDSAGGVSSLFKGKITLLVMERLILDSMILKEILILFRVVRYLPVLRLLRVLVFLIILFLLIARIKIGVLGS